MERPPSDVLDPDGIYPLHTLIKPISLRFKYHFEGDRETNQPDKVSGFFLAIDRFECYFTQPEWFFTHILNMSYEHRDFMDHFIQPLLDRSKYRKVNAWVRIRPITLHLSRIPVLNYVLERVHQATTTDLSAQNQSFSTECTILSCTFSTLD